MSQSVILPERCLACKSERIGVQEGRAQYQCGSSYRIMSNKGKRRLRVKRSLKCLGWEK